MVKYNRLVLDWSKCSGWYKIMASVGAYEAKTHFAQILDRVANGEKITITRHGVPVAEMNAVQNDRVEEIRQTIKEIKGLRKEKATYAEIKEMIEEGRRY